MLKLLLYTVVVVLLASCGQKAPGDSQVKDWYKELYNAWTEAADMSAKQKVFEGLAKKAESTFEVKAMTSKQIAGMLQAGDFDLQHNIKTWLAPFLTQQAEKKNLQGARAAYAAWKFFPLQTGIDKGQQSKAELKAYSRVLKHPAWKELVKAEPEIVTDMLRQASKYRGGDLVDDYGVAERWLVILDQELPEGAAIASISLFETMDRDSRVPPKVKELVRKQVLKQYITLLNSGKIQSKRKITELENTRNYLEGPYAKGELIGHQAPLLDFIWWSTGNEKTLEDFKGKVVLLDFWGTKCAPCISIFPEMRNLVAHYKGYPVEIVGIVSVQGYHVDVKNNKTIRTNGKPGLEMELMKSFMEDMKMTWRVAFTKQSVFNTDYGVKSIPHVVLIDANGVVRYNAIDPFEKAAEKIDILLQEAGLPYPKNKLLASEE